MRDSQRTWILPLMLVATCFGQTAVMRDCTQAFYRGDYPQAVQTAEKYLRTHPGDAPLRVMLARAELAQGNFAQAVEDLRKALASEPRNIDALYYLSLTAKELSRREYQKLFALDPNSDRVHQLLGEAALAAENHAEAETEFQNALKANPKSVEAAIQLAELKRSESKFDEALTYYEQAKKAGPLTYEVAYGIGACYTYKQDYLRAIEWLRKAVSLSPDAPAARFGLANALFQNGQVEGSIPELKVSLRLEPKMKQAYFLLGRAYSKLGRQEEAQAAFKKLDELNRSEVPNQDKTTSPPKPEAETH